MPEDTSKQGTTKENVSEELKALKTEIKGLAQSIRASIERAGKEAKDTWSKLDAERKRFLEKVEQAGEETAADLRHAGSDLKRRLEGLGQELSSKGGEQEEGQSEKPSS
jgi:acyl-CoA reductase-like NAD-dependent aldehyde dehydrogenase